MDKVKLTYFDGRGRCDFIRMLLHVGKVKFEDNRITGEQWKALKPKTPFGTLPMLEVNGTVIGDSLSAGRYAAVKAGLYGSDKPLVHAKIDEVVAIMTDIREKFFAGAFGKDSEKEKLIAEATEYAKNKLPCLSKVLGKNKYFVESKLSWADIHFFYVIEILSDVIKMTTLLDADKNLKELYDRVKEDKSLKEFVAKRPKTDF